MKSKKVKEKLWVELSFSIYALFVKRRKGTHAVQLPVDSS